MTREFLANNNSCLDDPGCVHNYAVISMVFVWHIFPGSPSLGIRFLNREVSIS